DAAETAERSRCPPPDPRDRGRNEETTVMSGQPRLRRTPVNAVVALVLTAAAALTAPVPASGAGPGTGGAAAGHGVLLPGTGPTGLPDTEVTLITGDRVLISTAPDGRTAVTVEPAAGTEPQSYQTVRAP